MNSPNSADKSSASPTAPETSSKLLLFPGPKRTLTYRWYTRLVKRIVRFLSAALLLMLFLMTSRDEMLTSFHYGKAGRVYLFGIVIEQAGDIDSQGMLRQASHSGIHGGWLVIYVVGGLLFAWVIWSWWQLLMHCNRLEYRQAE